MEIGWKAVLAALDKTEDDATISMLCDEIASAFLESVGASAGPLYASAFQSGGSAVADRLNLDAEALVAWIRGMADGIIDRGGASAGDKTMVDAWLPAVEAASEASTHRKA